jgi:dienelactone hydrolase
LGTETPAKMSKVMGQVAPFTGEDDTMIPATQVIVFRKEMEKASVTYNAGVAYNAATYADAKHSFINLMPL